MQGSLYPRGYMQHMPWVFLAEHGQRFHRLHRFHRSSAHAENYCTGCYTWNYTWIIVGLGKGQARTRVVLMHMMHT